MTEFDLLGIEVTTNKEAISEAYRKELTKHHPEEDPEGFKALREAYEKAMAYAEEHTADLDSPLSVYIGKVADVYENYRKRIQAAEWEALLSDPLVTGFETEKETRHAILSYIMDGHDLIKDEIWKLIEGKLLVGEHAEELGELLDPEFIQYIMLKKEGQIVEFFDYDALTGYPERDVDNVLDNYISAIKHLCQQGTNLTGEFLEQLKNTGLQHPLFDFLCRCYLVETEQADDALVDATDAEAKHYVETEIPQLGYRAYKVMALIAEKKNEIRDAFYFARMAAYPTETPDILEMESKYGDLLSAELKELSEMDENTVMVFLLACYMSGQYNRALVWLKKHPDQALDTSEFHFHLHLILAGAERFEEAEEELTKAEELFDGEDSFVEDWIRLYQKEDDPESVTQLCEEAHEKNPESLFVLNAWQEACEQLEWYAEVVDIMHMARDLNSDYAPFYIRAAKAYEESDYHRDAIAVLENAPSMTPEMYKILSTAYFKIFSDSSGHCGPTEAMRARQYADAYQQICGEDWELASQEGWMKVIEGENEAAIQSLEHAIELIKGQTDTMTEEEINGKIAGEMMYRIGRAYLSWREEKNAPETKDGMAGKALDVLEEAFAITTELGLYYDGITIFSRLIEACHITGELDRGLKDILDRERIFHERKEDTEMPYEYFMDWMVEELSIDKGDLATAKARMEHRVGASTVPAFRWSGADEDDEIEIVDVADCEEAVIMNYVIAPDMYTEDEKKAGLEKAIQSVMNWIKSDDSGEKDGKILTSYVLAILQYGPAISTDYEAMFEMGNSVKLANVITNFGKVDQQKDWASWMMRIANYLGKADDRLRFAKKYERLVTKNTPFCQDYKCTLEQACDGMKTGYTRMILVQLAAAKLFQGDLDEAKRIVEEIKDHPMCWYCSKTGCLEYNALHAEIALFEGDYDKARKYCELTNATQWHGHEELTDGILKYLEDK